VQIADAQAEAAKYKGGLLLTEIQLRQAILQNTLAMLEQRRLSWFHSITMVYQDPLPRILVEDPGVADELKAATTDADDAQKEAARYSGGLVQSMALVREATARVTVAAVQQRIELARSGISLPGMPTGGKPPPSAAPGKKSSDKDAL
jgi:hypothetical protein